MYHNRFPARLHAEVEAARRVGVVPVEVTSDILGEMATRGKRMIYAVVGDRLLVAAREAMGEHISHAVLVGGGPVSAAGEFEATLTEGTVEIVKLDNMSGHYRPGSKSLEIARAAFGAQGARVRAEGVKEWELQGS